MTFNVSVSFSFRAFHIIHSISLHFVNRISYLYGTEKQRHSNVIVCFNSNGSVVVASNDDDEII